MKNVKPVKAAPTNRRAASAKSAMSARSAKPANDTSPDAGPDATRFVVGCMTGTSLDGLDAAMVVVSGRGLSMKATLAGMVSLPMDGLKDELRHFASGLAAEPVRFLSAARKLGELHADAVEKLQARLGVVGLDFVVAHGQTIWHEPRKKRTGESGPSLSWQLFDPWPIVRRIGVPVCYDLRQADLIAGGQGAPITPMSDFVMYRKSGRKRLVVNLGGICNATFIPGGSDVSRIQGADIGPCNILLDGLVRECFPGREFDADGQIASTGTVRHEVVRFILSHPFLRARARGQGRSTGREDFTRDWVRSIIDRYSPRGISHADLHASGAKAVADILWLEAKAAGARELILAGGGARNPTLVRMIRSTVDGPALISDELGIPIEAREAMGFAVLGALSQDGIPITLPQVTGADRPGVAGAWAR